MKLPVIDNSGKKSGFVNGSDEIFAAPMNSALVAQAIHVYLSNQRQASAKAQTRGDVYGSRRKLWKQKGTGHARHGDKFAPQFVGGGVAHGPTGMQNFKLVLNEKMRRKALFCLLSQKLSEDKLTVISELKGFKKTSELVDFLSNIAAGDSPLVIDNVIADDVHRVARNISRAKLVTTDCLNALMIARAHKLIITKSGVNALESHFLSK